MIDLTEKNEVQKVSRLITIAIFIMIAFYVALILITLFSKRSFHSDELTNALKAQQKANIENQKTLQRALILQQESRDYLERRDSILTEKIKTTDEKISNVRNKEVISAIGSYNSADIQRAFANLERQYNYPR